jgi:hypothetical protein
MSAPEPSFFDGFREKARAFIRSDGFNYVIIGIFLFIVGLLMIIFIFTVAGATTNFKIIYTILGILVLLTGIVLIVLALARFKQSQMMAPATPPLVVMEPNKAGGWPQTTYAYYQPQYVARSGGVNYNGGLYPPQQQRPPQASPSQQIPVHYPLRSVTTPTAQAQSWKPHQPVTQRERYF